MTLRPPAEAIAITGFMATGKSTVGRLLAGRLGLELVDTDEMVEARAGCPIPQIFAERGEEEFRDLETAAVREAVATPGRVISTGGGVLLREQNVQVLRAAGPIVCLSAHPDAVLARTAGDETRPLLQVEDPAGRIRELLAAREEAYAQADYHVDTTDDGPEEVADRVLRLLREDARARWHVGARTTIPLRLDDAGYDIAVGRGLLDDLGSAVTPERDGHTAALVTTDRVGPLYAERARASLGAAGWSVSVMTVPDGEASKSLRVLGDLWERMASAGLDRGSFVFALGGGMVGDLAGFAAASYLRGIRLVHLPTSLLAQVDSSIGGKTGVDLSAGQDLVGAFHQPVAVVADVATLSTLPDEEMRSGLGEVIKHACCFDADMFGLLERRRDAVLGRDGATLDYLVARNCQIKAGVVEQDPREQGLRAVLNYGHTVGHALERAAPDWELRHGEVVAAGIVAESRLAARLGIADEETARRQERLVRDYGLPTAVAGVDEARAMQALERDKKIVGGRLRLPVVPHIGTFRMVEDVDLELVREALRSVLV